MSTNRCFKSFASVLLSFLLLGSLLGCPMDTATQIAVNEAVAERILNHIAIVNEVFRQNYRDIIVQETSQYGGMIELRTPPNLGGPPLLDEAFAPLGDVPVSGYTFASVRTHSNTPRSFNSGHSTISPAFSQAL